MRLSKYWRAAASFLVQSELASTTANKDPLCCAPQMF